MSASEIPPEVRALYPFKPHWLDTPAGRMHCIDEGPSDAKEAVICVHGNPTWSFMYRELVKKLAPDFRVIAVDHLGCGLSDKPQNFSYRLADHIKNLAQLVATIKQPKVHFVVHDWGGAIGMGVAARIAERVGRIVVMNTAAFHGPCPMRIRICRLPVLGPLIVRGLNGFALPATRMAVARPLSDAVTRGYLFPYRSWAERVAVLRFVQDIPVEPGHPSAPALREVESGLEKLRDKPMFIGWGMRDFCFTPWYLAEWKRRFPNAHTTEYPDAGHYVIEDAGLEIIPAVSAFLRAG